MKIFSELINEEIVKMLLARKVDVERVFALQGRDDHKLLIVLIAQPKLQ